MPPPRSVPQFAPVRVRGMRYGPWRRRWVRRGGRGLAAGLALIAAALVVADAGGDGRARGHPAPAGTGEERRAERVTAPVRIADGATVRLLRAGDRVDVVAAQGSAAGGDARVVARGALVTEVPEPVDESAGTGALVVLSVPRATAARLVGAGTTGRLAVTLC
ncbi:hypothetical protein ABZX40_37145 [Streptomyces sp. NPDC004610]|uniref:hypothetical protein n=1 Tax=unclassified Streptomyces TaxID=2593676 RepID=UPI0033AD4DC1